MGSLATRDTKGGQLGIVHAADGFSDLHEKAPALLSPEK